MHWVQRPWQSSLPISEHSELFVFSRAECGRWCAEARKFLAAGS